MATTRFIGSTGYWFVKLPDGSLVGEHRLVYERHHGPIPEGWHVHHRDGDKLNNRPENLEALPWPEHKRVHEGHWLGEDGRWWKCCRTCGMAAPEDDFPTKCYRDGVRLTRGNCRSCERDRQRAKSGWKGGSHPGFGRHYGPSAAGTTS